LVLSTVVAKLFGRAHKNVLSDIRALDLGSDSSAAWFLPTTYIGKDNAKAPAFDMTKDGFTLLVFGWTGAKALRFKIAYITEFNRMEAALRQVSAPLALPNQIATARARRTSPGRCPCWTATRKRDHRAR
jgi:anti-repressor protein